MKYEVYILRRAQKELASLPFEAHNQIKDAILSLADEPRPTGCKKVTAYQGWRIRARARRAEKCSASRLSQHSIWARQAVPLLV